MEFPFAGQSAPVFAFLKPASRGTINIASSDPNVEPAIDFKALSNPVDLQVFISIFRFMRKFFNSSTMAQLGPVELLPGPSVSTDADITAALRNMLVQPSFFHACCTAAMMPKNKGGVVGTDLLVYGVKNVSIVDASIMPLIPGTHTCETVYAIAEKVRISHLITLHPFPSRSCLPAGFTNRVSGRGPGSWVLSRNSISQNVRHALTFIRLRILSKAAHRRTRPEDLSQGYCEACRVRNLCFLWGRFGSYRFGLQDDVIRSSFEIGPIVQFFEFITTYQYTQLRLLVPLMKAQEDKAPLLYHRFPTSSS